MRVEPRQGGYRRPWLWLVVISVVALISCLAVLRNAEIRISDRNERALSEAQLRLKSVHRRIEAYFADAFQIVRIDARALGSPRAANFETARWIVQQSYLGKADPVIYGVGAFYEPGVIGHPYQVGVYDHGGGVRFHGDDRVLGGGLVEVIDLPGPGASSYHKYIWYADALHDRGAIGVYGPYDEEGRRFVTVMAAIMRDGRAIGVSGVDALQSRFAEMFRAGPDDVVWAASTKNDAYFTGTGPVPKAKDRIVVSAPLPNLHAKIVLSVDPRTTRLANRQTQIWAGSIVALIVLSAMLVTLIVFERARAKFTGLALQAEQLRLEDEIQLAHRVEAELREAGFKDALTGLPNRVAFIEHLGALENDGGGSGYAVFLIDVDRFNIVNETLGHAAGDELLRILAHRLWSETPSDVFVARLGGDEFVVVHPGDGTHIDVTARDLLGSIAQPAVLGGQTLHMKASVGIVALGDPSRDAADVLRDAEIAVYAAKERGRARWAVFDAEMRENVESRARLEADLRRGIERGELIAHYQPVVDIATGDVVSFEALARWSRLGEGVISAAKFVPIAEERGIVYELDSVILREVFSQAATLFALYPQATVAINISAAELTVPGLADQIEALLWTYGVEPKRIRLEITETTMMTRGDDVRSTLEHLRQTGIELLLDDFGTGYSSLAYLQRLPISGVKIDRTFVERLTRDPRAVELVRSIVAIASTFGLHTTAEGVESREQLEQLATLGVDYAQGFLFSPAVSIAALASLRLPDGRFGLSNIGK